MAYCDNVVERKRNCPYHEEEVETEDCQDFGSTIVVPELEVYARRFIIESEVNKHGVPFPPEITSCEDCFREGSFITMMFDECYDLDHYRYLYVDVEDKLDWPLIINRRLNVYPVSGRYYELNDDEGRNLFLLQDDDFTMLDSLLIYRNDSTNLTVIDTTGVTTLTYDTTADIYILTTCLDCLETDLSKLIFVYLDLLINKNLTNYSTDDPVSTDYSLQTVFELFVIDKYFEYVSCLAIDVRQGARDPDYTGIPYDPSGGHPNPPGGDDPTNEACEDGGATPIAPDPSILKYPPSRKISDR